jgi:hypothetical protein
MHDGIANGIASFQVVEAPYSARHSINGLERDPFFLIARQHWSSFPAKGELFMPWCDVAENRIPSIGHEENPPHSCHLTLGQFTPPYPGGNEITEASASISWPPISVTTIGQSGFGACLCHMLKVPGKIMVIITQSSTL